MEIVYSDDRVKAKIEIVKASVLDGMRRVRLHFEAEESTEENLDRRILRRITYPDLIAASQNGSLTIEGVEQTWPPDFETFLKMPEELGIQWEQKVYELNPHWLPSQADASEKKASAIGTGD